MTTQTQERIPEWTLGDRLRKARALTGLNTRDFADKIGVSQPTVTAAENDKNKVRTITINAWALVTGVSREWLETGEAPTQPDGPDGGVPEVAGELAKLASRKRSATRDRNTRRYPTLAGSAA